MEKMTATEINETAEKLTALTIEKYGRDVAYKVLRTCVADLAPKSADEQAILALAKPGTVVVSSLIAAQLGFSKRAVTQVLSTHFEAGRIKADVFAIPA